MKIYKSLYDPKYVRKMEPKEKNMEIDKNNVAKNIDKNIIIFVKG
jgi:hypothetical protein